MGGSIPPLAPNVNKEEEMDAYELIQEMRTVMPGGFSSDLQDHLVNVKQAFDSEIGTEYRFERNNESGQYEVLVIRGDVRVKFEFEVKFQLGKAYVLS